MALRRARILGTTRVADQCATLSALTKRSTSRCDQNRIISGMLCPKFNCVTSQEDHIHICNASEKTTAHEYYSLHQTYRITELKPWESRYGTTWSREMPMFTGVLQPDESLTAMSQSGLVKILIAVSLFVL